MTWDRLQTVVTPSIDDLEPRADYDARRQLFGALAAVFGVIALAQLFMGDYLPALGALVLVVALAAWAVRSHRLRQLRR